MTDRPMMRIHVYGFAVATLTMTAATIQTSAVLAQPTPQKTTPPAAKVQIPPRSVIQKLRAFLGVNPPVAVGGSRSGGGKSVCLLSPWPSPDRKGEAVPVTVVVSRPVLLAAGQLNELRLEKGERILWQERASSTQPIEGPIAWPIQPLKPGEQLTLKVRPRGASGGDFATFSLRAADAEILADNDRKIQNVGTDPKAIERFLGQLKPQQRELAAALLSRPQVPAELRSGLQCLER